jgi:hypothetical protein
LASGLEGIGNHKAKEADQLIFIKELPSLILLKSGEFPQTYTKNDGHFPQGCEPPLPTDSNICGQGKVHRGRVGLKWGRCREARGRGSDWHGDAELHGSAGLTQQLHTKVHAEETHCKVEFRIFNCIQFCRSCRSRIQLKIKLYVILRGGKSGCS